MYFEGIMEKGEQKRWECFGAIDGEMISVGVWHAFSTCIFERVRLENNIDNSGPRHKTGRGGRT